MSKFSDNSFINFSDNDFIMITTTSLFNNNFKDLLKQFNLNNNIISEVNQVHSNNIVVSEDFKMNYKADGMISKNDNLALKISTADCIPIFIHDTKNFYGLIHAGWRGVVKEIHLRALDKFMKLGVDLDKIKIILGPMIQNCCFEIKNDIIDNFKSKYIINRNHFKTVDLSAIVIDDLCEQGIIKNNIFSSDICSFHDERCYSYRKNKTENRMYSIIAKRS